MMAVPSTPYILSNPHEASTSEASSGEKDPDWDAGKAGMLALSMTEMEKHMPVLSPHFPSDGMGWGKHSLSPG